MRTLASGNRQSWLLWFLRGLLVLGFFILAGRLFDLQIIKGAYYRDLAEGNRIRKVPIVAKRGNILARGGEILVGNREVKKRVIFDVNEGYKKIEEIDDGAGEDEIVSEWERVYELGEMFAHVSGYLGEVGEEEVSKVDPDCLQKGPRKLGALIGRDGLEEEYDCTLRGIDGEELVEVDTFGKRVRTLGRKNPIPGTDIKTTIDINLQKKVAEVLGDMESAFVATEKHGEVLAFYSGPSYDPTNIAEYLEDEDLPLFNRVIGGGYHPGSIYKIVTAVAAIEEGEVDREYTYEDTGVIKISDEYEYFNWYLTQYGRVEGEIDLTKALARSTDTFFYKAGELIGIDRLVDWSRKFGLGEITNLDLPGEVGGFLPTPSWKRAIKGERWFLGNTYHMAIGQGDLTATPMQMNMLVSVIGNEGKLCQPRVGPRLPSLGKGEASKCKELHLKDESLELVREGMEKACESGGTAYPFFDFSPKVACKTGTAETFEEGVTHAWFSVIAPMEFPEIVATVLLPKGGEGSKDAAPVMREILDFYFHPNEIDKSSDGEGDIYEN